MRPGRVPAARTGTVPGTGPPRAHSGLRDLAPAPPGSGCGHTANVPAAWRAHGVDRLLHEAYDRGVPLCGVSAGADCRAEASHTDSSGPLTCPPTASARCPAPSARTTTAFPAGPAPYRAAVGAGALPSGWGTRP